MSDGDDSAIRRRLGEKKYRRLLLLLKWTATALNEIVDIEQQITDDGGSSEHDALHGLSADMRETLATIIRTLQEIEASDARPAEASLSSRDVLRLLSSQPKRRGRKR